MGWLLGITALVCVLVAPVSAFGYKQSYNFVTKWTATPGIPAGYAYGMGLGMGGGSSASYFVSSHANYVGVYDSTGGLTNQAGESLTNVFGSEGLQQVDNLAIYNYTDMWVVDAGNMGVAKLLINGDYQGVSISGVPGSAFDQPIGIAVDASACVYVTDRGGSTSGSRVSKFTTDGTFVASFGEGGSNYLWSASSVSVGPHFEVYVTDWLADKVRRYKPKTSARDSYVLDTSWSLVEPKAVSVDIAGNVFVVDDSTQATTKFDPSGEKLAKWGGPGTGSGLFANAWSVAAWGHLGHVWIDDRDDASVQEFVLTDLRPTTSASANLSVKKGKSVTFKYKAGNDEAPNLSVTIKVYKGSSLKATIKCGSVGQGVWNTKKWTCKLAKGSYTWKVYATDIAARTQRNIASKSLKVS